MEGGTKTPIPPPKLDYWTEFFRKANGDIFDVIENAIHVAAIEFPQELRARRDRIVERLYTPAVQRCFGCVEEAGSVKHVAVNGVGDVNKQGPEDIHRMVVASGSGGSNFCSYDMAEAVTEEIERESETVGEVLRIKDIVLNKDDQSESELFESLRRLQLMELSVETLQATEIGKAVNALKKHNSKSIRHMARILLEGWKVLVDAWLIATGTIAGNKDNDLVNDPVANNDNDNDNNNNEELDEGLPSPPLDEGAFLATQTTSIQLSEFFDGMDDDGNLRTEEDLDANREAERKPVLNSNSNTQRQVKSQEPAQISKQEQVLEQEEPAAQISKQEQVQTLKQEEPAAQISKQAKPPKPTSFRVKPLQVPPPQVPPPKLVKPVNAESGPERAVKTGDTRSNQTRALSLDPAQRKPPAARTDDRSKLQEEAKPEASKRLVTTGDTRSNQTRAFSLDPAQRKPLAAQTDDRSKLQEEAKLEASKRKLHERYQEAENAKRQRTIQVMELNDIPKQKPALQNRQSIMKPKSTRNWALRRH